MAHLYYIHDPMCSWCWGFRPTYMRLLAKLPPLIDQTNLLGGLAPDTDLPMDDMTRTKLQETWRNIQLKLPDTEFNFEFWNRNTPKRSTYPACRAVISARHFDRNNEDKMVLAIQKAYYLRAMNPSDSNILIRLAGEIGITESLFESVLYSDNTADILNQEIAHSRSMGASSFPSLVLENKSEYFPVKIDYRDENVILVDILQLCT